MLCSRSEALLCHSNVQPKNETRELRYFEKAIKCLIILDYVSIITCRVVVLASNKPLKPSRMKILQ